MCRCVGKIWSEKSSCFKCCCPHTVWAVKTAQEEESLSKSYFLSRSIKKKSQGLCRLWFRSSIYKFYLQITTWWLGCWISSTWENRICALFLSSLLDIIPSHPKIPARCPYRIPAAWAGCSHSSQSLYFTPAGPLQVFRSVPEAPLFPALTKIRAQPIVDKSKIRQEADSETCFSSQNSNDCPICRWQEHRGQVKMMTQTHLRRSTESGRHGERAREQRFPLASRG